MVRVVNNSYKQYCKSRPAPSSESLKRSKNFANLRIGFHPIFGMQRCYVSVFCNISGIISMTALFRWVSGNDWFLCYNKHLSWGLKEAQCSCVCLRACVEDFIRQCFSTFLLEWNDLEHLEVDCLPNLMQRHKGSFCSKWIETSFSHA